MKTILAPIGSGSGSNYKTAAHRPTTAFSTLILRPRFRMLVAGMARGRAVTLRVAATVVVSCVFAPIILLAWLAVGLDKMNQTSDAAR